MSVIRVDKLIPALLASVAVQALTACGGGHRTAALPPVAPSSGVSQGTSTVLRITVPPKAASAASVRRAPRYISPATQSVAISLQSRTTLPQTFNQDLTPANNPNCTASLVSPTVCTVTLPLAPGIYVASFSTFDGLLDARGNPTGNELSANQNVQFTIVPGQANAINVTFQGIPTALAFLPGATSALRGTRLGPYSLSACVATGPQTVTVVGLDADGNFILGPGAPVPSLSAIGGSTTVSIGTPATSSPNTFTITTQPGVAAGQSVVLAAAVTPPRSAPNDSGANPVTALIQLGFDTNLCGGFTEYADSSASSAVEITAGPDGALWFTGGAFIHRLSTAGVFSQFALPNAASTAQGIATAPDGSLWFTEPSVNLVGRITTTGTIAEFATLDVTQPAEIVAGPDGAMWFTGAGPLIGRLPLTATPAATGLLEFGTTVTTTQRIAFASDGTLWTTAIGQSGRAVIDRLNIVTRDNTVFDTALAGPAGGIAGGPDGGTWFTDPAANRIGRIAPNAVPRAAGAVRVFLIPTAGADPQGITAGPDGALWFVERHANKIGRITTTGLITEFAIPTAGAGGQGIATGSDGALWFTEPLVGQFGQLSSAPVIAISPPSQTNSGCNNVTGCNVATVIVSEPSNPAYNGGYTIAISSNANVCQLFGPATVGNATAAFAIGLVSPGPCAFAVSDTQGRIVHGSFTVTP
jgi:virginiamycin B lyase